MDNLSIYSKINIHGNIKYKSGVWRLKVIYIHGRKREEIVSHYRSPSHPKPNICLSGHKRDTVDPQAGCLKLYKTFIKT